MAGGIMVPPGPCSQMLVSQGKQGYRKQVGFETWPQAIYYPHGI